MSWQFWKKKEQQPEGAPTKGGMAVKEEKPAQIAKGAPKAKAVSTDTKLAPSLLLRPQLTEKSTQAGVYYFQVPIRANRSEVKKAIQAVYGVKPVKVNMQNRLGKVKNFGRMEGRRSDWKRAIVMLKKGESISTE